MTNPIKVTRSQWKRMQKNINGGATDCKNEALISIKVRSMLMTQFLLDWEKLTGKRVTPELIRSPLWKEMRDKYVELLTPLLVEQEKGK